MTRLPRADPVSPAPSPLDGLSDTAKAYAQDAYADNTKRAYRAAWRQYAGWCEEQALEALPSTPEQVANYLAAIAPDLKPSTLSLRLASIAKAHHLAGHPLDTRHPAIGGVLRGIKRQKGVRPAKKDAVDIAALRAVCSTIADDTKGRRDRALFLIGFAAALRRSELVALNRDDIGPHENGIIVTIRRSKTDAEGAGTEIAIYRGRDRDLCPVRALEAWLGASDKQDDHDPAVFRRLTKGGAIKGRLTDRSVARIVKGRCQEAGIAGDFAGHSLRAGLCTAAAEAGYDLSAIVRQSRHKSLDTAHGYIRTSDLWRENVTGGLL